MHALKSFVLFRCCLSHIFIAKQNEKINQRSRNPSIAPTSFLWNAYYPNRYYYEVKNKEHEISAYSRLPQARVGVGRHELACRRNIL